MESSIEAILIALGISLLLNIVTIALSSNLLSELWNIKRIDRELLCYTDSLENALQSIYNILLEIRDMQIKCDSKLKFSDNNQSDNQDIQKELNTHIKLTNILMQENLKLYQELNKR